MRITIYAQPYLPSVGGVQISTSLMREALTEMGHEVKIITQTPSDLKIGTAGEPGILRKPRLLQLFRAIRSTELLIVRGGVALQAALPAIILGTPFIIFHEMAGPYFESGKSLLGLTKATLRKFCAKRCMSHVGVSKGVLPTLALPSNSQVHVLYNPIHAIHENSTPLEMSGRDIDVLYVGRMIAHKGILLLPGAVMCASTHIERPISVVALGGGPDLDRLKKLAVSDVYNNWKFVDEADQQELATYYRRAKVVTVPSTTHLEGMCMVAAEAISHGTPVVHSPQAPISETTALGGIQAEPSDCEKFGSAISTLLRDTDGWKSMSLAAKLSSVRFSAKTYRKALEELLNESSITVKN